MSNVEQWSSEMAQLVRVASNVIRANGHSELTKRLTSPSTVTVTCGVCDLEATCVTEENMTVYAEGNLMLDDCSEPYTYEIEELQLGSCGCIDTHMADCPTRGN